MKMRGLRQNTLNGGFPGASPKTSRKPPVYGRALFD
jgi:hypothetical protein